MTPSEHQERMTIYVPTELRRRLRIYAAECDRDMSEIVTEALEAYLPKKMRVTFSPAPRSRARIHMGKDRTETSASS